MVSVDNLFEGCSIGRFKMSLVFKYKQSCTIHSTMLTDNDNAKYRIAVNLFINDNNECEFEWAKIYYNSIHKTRDEITDEDITPFERMSVQLFLKFIMEN